MYEIKNLERFLRVNLLGPGLSSYKKIIYRAAVSQRLGNTGVDGSGKEFRVKGTLPNEPFISWRHCQAVYEEQLYLRLSVRMQQIESSRAHLKYSRLQRHS
jgi:hypothetical protein